MLRLHSGEETLVSSSSTETDSSMNGPCSAENGATKNVSGSSSTDYASSDNNPESPSNFLKSCFYDPTIPNDIFNSSSPHSGDLFQGGSQQPPQGKQPLNIKLEPKLEPGTVAQCYQGFSSASSQPPTPSTGYTQVAQCSSMSGGSTSSFAGPMFSQPAPSSPMFPQPSPVSGSVVPDSTSFLHFPKAVGIADRRMSDSTLIIDDVKNSLTPGPGSFVEGQPLRSHSVCEYGPYPYGCMRMPGQDHSKHDPTYGSTASAAADSSAAAGVNVPGVSAVGQKAFVPCKVCGDKASGYHYGVTSCEGCKGFFRRSIQKQIEYRCLRDGKCMVFRLNRNRCQYCRFKKCLAVGMSRDSVRYGRVPKRSRDRMQDDSRVSSMTGDSEVDSELEKRQLALYDIILSVSQAHHSNCAYTDDKIKNLSHRPMPFPLERCTVNEDDPVGSTDLLEQQKIIMWESMARFTTTAIQRVVEFAKRIPGFTELVQDDQLILIKTGFFEVWLVRIARMFNPTHFTVTFSDGSFVTRDQLDLIYNPELVSAMFNFSISCNNLHLNDGEVGLFTAVVLLTQDRPGLNDPKTVEQLQEKLIEALKLQLSRSHSSDPQVFPNLLMKLSELRTVGSKHNEVLGWYRMNYRRLKLPPLYAEIYDIQKCEELPNGTNGPLTNGHGLCGQAPQIILPESPLINGPPSYPQVSSGHHMQGTVVTVNGGFHGHGGPEFPSQTPPMGLQSVGH